MWGIINGVKNQISKQTWPSVAYNPLQSSCLLTSDGMRSAVDKLHLISKLHACLSLPPAQA